MIRPSPVQARDAKPLRRFLRGEHGAILVEFAMVLPMMLIVFAVIIEGARLLWSYQCAVNGVREASRYLSRIAPANICVTGGTLDADQAALTAIVQNGLDGATTPLFPSDVTVDSVTPSYSCDTGTYRNSPVAIGSVQAAITITYPFAAIFNLAGGAPASITTTITNQSRIYGS